MQTQESMKVGVQYVGDLGACCKVLRFFATRELLVQSEALMQG